MLKNKRGECNNRMNNKTKLAIFGAIVAVALLLSLIIVSGYMVYAQSSSDCQSKKDDLLSRFQSWNKRWNEYTSDPQGQLRAEGRQLVAEIVAFMKDCADSIDSNTVSLLTSADPIITDQIDRDVNLGPSCDPTSQDGPPIS